MDIIKKVGVLSIEGKEIGVYKSGDSYCFMLRNFITAFKIRDNVTYLVNDINRTGCKKIPININSHPAWFVLENSMVKILRNEGRIQTAYKLREEFSKWNERYSYIMDNQDRGKVHNTVVEKETIPQVEKIGLLGKMRAKINKIFGK